MKKQINVFDACTRINIIASQYFNITSIHIDLIFRPDHSRHINVFCHYILSDKTEDYFITTINENEIKFGLDLIYSRVLKDSIAHAIELKIYNPPILVI